MTNSEIYAKLDKVGCLTFSTKYENEIHSRIAHFFAFDAQGFYFRTMHIKPFYRQLKANSQVTVCGQYPSSQITSQSKEGTPFFLPGYTIRITGFAQELTQNEINTKAAENPDFKVLVYDQEAYPATRAFCMTKGKGEIVDYDFELINRDHKLLRTRFSFGGMSFNPAGSRITDACVGCGRCVKVCTFAAIMPRETTATKQFQIIPERCNECGTCVNTCPEKAILEPLQF